MNHYFTWLIESGISLAIFYLAYRFFLNRENLFQSNRSYLLFALFLSTVLPFLNIPSPVNLHYSHYLAEVVVTSNAMPVSTEAAKQVSVLEILSYIYFLGVVIMTGTFLYRLIQLFRIIRNSQMERKGKIRLAKTKLNHAPFSFLHMIVYNEENLSKEEKDKIMEHEAVHVKQLHTLDILLVEIIAILQWFNPFVWLYKTSLKELHEYLADREVIRKGTNIPVYQQLLLNFQLRRQYITLANNFNYSLTKKRFIMMTKTRKNPLASARFLLILPALIAIISLTKLNAAGNLNTQSPPPEEIFIEVEKMPKFGQEDEEGLAFRKYIAENLKYPAEAAKKGIEGRVFVQFIVDYQGKVKDTKVIRGVHELLDAEALRVVETSPDWIPGTQRGKAVNVQYVFPISFVLGKDKKE